MLKVENISKKYSYNGKLNKKGWRYVVKNISIEFQHNQIYALVGESGSGKSTLARILSYIEKPTSGTIVLEGKPINQYTREELRKKRSVVQLVMQDAESSLDPRQKVTELLDEPLKHLVCLSKEQRSREKSKLLRMVGISDDLLQRLPRELSGGQQKRICIARALSVEPKLIIFDESFNGLDVILKKQILDLLKDLKKEVLCSYLIITHDLDVAMYMANHIFVMKDGELVESVANPKSFDDFKSSYANEMVKALQSKRHALH